MSRFSSGANMFLCFPCRRWLLTQYRVRCKYFQPNKLTLYSFNSKTFDIYFVIILLFDDFRGSWSPGLIVELTQSVIVCADYFFRYVGNLSRQVTEELLFGIFSELGSTTCKMMNEVSSVSNDSVETSENPWIIALWNCKSIIYIFWIIHILHGGWLISLGWLSSEEEVRSLLVGTP